MTLTSEVGYVGITRTEPRKERRHDNMTPSCAHQRVSLALFLRRHFTQPAELFSQEARCSEKKNKEKEKKMGLLFRRTDSLNMAAKSA